MRIDRVILATDLHPSYRPFLPVAASAWAEALGAVPTIAVIAPPGTAVEEGPADIIRFDPIPGVDTGLHAQVVRLLLPTLFPSDVSLLADIDMVPLDARYFAEALVAQADDAFVVLRDRAYDSGEPRYAVCYNAARGDTFSDVFGVSTRESFADAIAEWSSLGLGWHSDELILYRTLQEWPDRDRRLVTLGGRVTRRLDRPAWRFSPLRVAKRDYIDAHLSRPYAPHRESITQMLDVSAGRLPPWRALLAPAGLPARVRWLRDAVTSRDFWR